MSAGTFTAMQVLFALLAGVSTTLLLGVTLAAAEAATRHAFPRHLDWWKLWRYRGTREVASRVGGGYAVAAIAFAYVAVFYVVTRTLFGWWVPSALLDDPNQIASPMPWITGIAMSANAAVWEEALFRALPLSLLSLWIGPRPRRRWWMAAGVVASALIFGFAHSNYESWPPYSRGVEIFLDACFWAVLFLRFGLVVTVVAHFVYDAVLFGLFAASGKRGRVSGHRRDPRGGPARAGARRAVAGRSPARVHPGSGRRTILGLDASRRTGADRDRIVPGRPPLR